MSTPSVSLGQLNFCDAWKDALGAVVAELGVSSPAVTLASLAPAERLSPEERVAKVVIRFAASGPLTGEFLWIAENSVALRLAQLLMSEPADPATEFTETHRDGFGEFMRQAAGHAASLWKQKTSQEINFTFQSESLPPEAAFPNAAALELSADGLAVSLTLAVNEQLTQSFESFHLAPAPQPAPPRASSPQAPQPQPAEPSSDPLTEVLPANLDLLLDVELEATIRFGERELLLRDVFALMPGSVVELNQLVNEPAQLLVAGRTIARGEVVVVDGNFGLRVSEVASRSQRAEVIPS